MGREPGLIGSQVYAGKCLLEFIILCFYFLSNFPYSNTLYFQIYCVGSCTFPPTLSLFIGCKGDPAY